MRRAAAVKTCGRQARWASAGVCGRSARAAVKSDGDRADPGGGPLTTLVLPHRRSSAAEARRRLLEELRSTGLAGEVLDDAMLVVSELVGNAVLHGRPLAGGEIQVEWDADQGEVALRITDGGGLAVPEPRDADTLAPSGRGLAIVAEVADAWGVEERPDRLTVWARLQASKGSR